MYLLGKLTQFRASFRTFSMRWSGHLVLLLLATFLWTLLWAWSDIMVVRRAFPPPNSPASNVGYYWIAIWNVVFPLTTLFAFRKHAWLPLLAVILGGWEDILFYWIQGLPVPQDVPWLALTQTAELLYLKAVVFLAASILAEYVGHRLAPSWRRSGVMLGLLVTVLLDPRFGVFFVLLALPSYFILQRVITSVEGAHPFITNPRERDS